MHPLRQACVGIASRLLANRPAQKMLQRAVFYGNYLMGIGAGAHAGSSGEAGVLCNLHRFGSPPHIIFDVGANRGQFLRLAIGLVGTSEAGIHCFEPSSAAFELLHRDFAGRHNVRLNNFALGAEKREAVLYYDAPGSGLASLTQRRLEHLAIDHSEREPVMIETVDSYCEGNGIDAITLLKIDVEGHELDVLRGAARMFARRAIGAVSFEFGGCNIDTRTFLQDYWYFFREARMQLHRVTPSGYLYRIDAYSETMEQMTTTNFVAVS